MRVAICMVAAFVLAGCSEAPDRAGETTTAVAATPQSDVVRFVVVGDTGTGEAAQYAVASAIREVCQRKGCDFAVTTGDNIYEVGVASDRDPQFEAKFERPYRELEFPFFMSLGNHDNGGTGTVYAVADFQVDYHHRTDRMSDKWQMPARWYDHQQGHIQFVAMDTNLMEETPPGGEAAGWDPQAQKSWLQDTLGRPTNATWRIAYGHHPYISNGQHGDANSGRAAFFRDTICGEVDLLLTGHDHDLQWLASVDSCGKTEFIVSGAGAKQRSIASPDRNEPYFQKGDIHGFFWIEIAGERLRGEVYDADARLLFERDRTRAG